ncbi:LLM class F420-dependent oxidoreductase [Streptomyces sp. UNOC14_S4]|uniref:LLM class F420-dependent oxidoreductase n=1 Tax=Streptomyces sp. UNOC14_S4 TaxID=2872340 RepID=UPI001E47B7F2|nr:LLM class F420-dependent oxidoreductase [Streptomyces sp. UNOC14_S4]MCC3768594.1 LLM class F420-dependent oxidoreductase [Streptomyces sp. UNOC14_S4]
MARPFRFAVNMLSAGSAAEWREKCRRAESLGYDVILVPDHLGMPAPFPSLVAAAEATERPRLGTFVLNAGLWNPTLLAREVATTDLLTGGRLELGLGAGYVKEEHDRAGLPFGSPRERVDHLEHTVTELARLLGDPGHVPQPVQAPRPPLLLGGNGDRVLRLAARHADIMAFSGGGTAPDGSLRLADPDALEKRVAAYRGFAADRPAPAELNFLVQVVSVGGDPRAKARELIGYTPDLPEEAYLDHPALLTGSVREIADRVRGHRERYGFTYFTILEPYLEEFAPVIEELRG